MESQIEYCKYHPLQAATFVCNSCDVHCCDECTEVGLGGRSFERCLVCGVELESLGATYNAEPFWRRIEQSFRYPLNAQTMTLIVGVSALTAVLSFLPFTIIWVLMLTGALMRYAFTCLEQSSQGILDAPDITEAYQGGLHLLLQLLLIFISVIAMVVGVGKILGLEFAMFVGVLSVIALPAIIINFATTEDLTASLSPFKTFGLITAIGLPYGLLLGFILIMSASVGALQGLVGQEFSLVNMILQSIIANYYLIVIFHIMGYMIFQYQGKLGFTARVNSDEGIDKTELETLLAKIDVSVKEGAFDDATDLFSKAVRKFPRDGVLLNRCFDFLYASKEKDDLDAFAPRYMDYLVKQHAEDKLNIVYKKTLQVVPDFLPESPVLRYVLAKECHRLGDSRSVIKLVNGLHKQNPEFDYLVEAYELLCDALKDMPQMGSQADKCLLMVKKLKVSRKTRPRPMPKAKFEGQELQPAFAENDQVFDMRDDRQSGNEEAYAMDESEYPEEPVPKELPPIEFK